MATLLTMPKLGLTMTEGTISKWNKREGESVAAGEVLFVVSTDKLTYEYQSPEAGTLLKIAVADGTSVPVGATVGALGEAGEIVDLAGVALPQAEPTKTLPATATSAVAAPAAVMPAVRSGGPLRATPKARRLARDKAVDLSVVPGHGEPPVIHVADLLAWLDGHTVKTSPVAARLAADLGVDLTPLGTGGRRVMKADVLAAASASVPAASQTDRYLPMTKMRQIIAARMTESGTRVPTVNYQTDLDCTAMMALRESFKSTAKVSFNDLIMFAVSRVMADFPMCNCSTDEVAGRYVLHDSVNVGLAIAVEGGLLVPNVKNVQTMGLGQLASATADLIERGRKGQLLPDEMTGGTFTVTSLGAFGINRFTPIINPPESCILGVTAIEQTPVVRDGAIVARPMSSLCLTADHRSVDGAMAAQFLARLCQVLENPALLLL